MSNHGYVAPGPAKARRGGPELCVGWIDEAAALIPDEVIERRLSRILIRGGYAPATAIDGGSASTGSALPAASTKETE